MRRRPPEVRSFMSRLPVEILDTQSVGEALEAMQREGIRHIPVLRGAHLVGLLSVRDVDRLRAEHGPEALHRTVGEACSRQLVTVSPVAPLDEVVAEMLEHHVGSALVVDDGIIVGIFTTVDAMRALLHVYQPTAVTPSPSRSTE